MKKQQFLAALKTQLSHLPESEVTEILRDQEEYIRDAIAAGRSEEKVVESLGDPKTFAASVSAESKIHRAETSASLKTQVSSTLGAVFAILALAPLNIIFALGPFIALVGIAFGGWGVALGSFFVSVVLFFAFLVKGIFIAAGIWAHFSVLFFILGCFGVSVIGLIVMYKITQMFLKMTISYLKWNLNFIKGRA
jgi:uncharacterized membrane protein